MVTSPGSKQIYNMGFFLFSKGDAEQSVGKNVAQNSRVWGNSGIETE